MYVPSAEAQLTRYEVIVAMQLDRFERTKPRAEEAHDRPSWARSWLVGSYGGSATGSDPGSWACYAPIVFAATPGSRDKRTDPARCSGSR